MTAEASPSDRWVVTLVYDQRGNKNIPEGLIGDKSGHAIAWDGSYWYDYGVFIGATGGTGYRSHKRRT